MATRKIRSNGSVNIHAESTIIREQVIHVMIDPDSLDPDVETLRIFIHAGEGNGRGRSVTIPRYAVAVDERVKRMLPAADPDYDNYA